MSETNEWDNYNNYLTEKKYFKNEKNKLKNKNWCSKVVKIFSTTSDESIPLNYCKSFIYH